MDEAAGTSASSGASEESKTSNQLPYMINDQLMARVSRYRDVAYFEQLFGVADLPQVYASGGLAGVSRLIIKPSFQPESIHTFRFAGEEVEIESVRAKRSLWGTVDGRPWEGTTTENFTVSIETLPGVLNWDQLKLAVDAAGNQRQKRVRDGTRYIHRIVDDSTDVSSNWHSPDIDDPNEVWQLHLVAAYSTALGYEDPNLEVTQRYFDGSLHRSMAMKELAEIEATLGLRLPSDYVEFVSQYPADWEPSAAGTLIFNRAVDVIASTKRFYEDAPNFKANLLVVGLNGQDPLVVRVGASDCPLFSWDHRDGEQLNEEGTFTSFLKEVSEEMIEQRQFR